MNSTAALALGCLAVLASGCPEKKDADIQGNRGVNVEHEPARNPAPLNNHDEKAGQERTEGKDLEGDAGH